MQFSIHWGLMVFISPVGQYQAWDMGWLIHQGFRCKKHWGLTVFLDEKYSYKLLDVLEGFFIDVDEYN